MIVSAAARSLLDFMMPEICCLCGIGVEDGPWTLRKGRVSGLRPWDRTHLCAVCWQGLLAPAQLRWLPRAKPQLLPVAAGRATGADLVALVQAWKYHGVRGLAWPLASLALRGHVLATRSGGAVDALVPVPLHRGRRRVRGFNQAELLARLLAQRLGLPLRTDIVTRRRATRQQAQIPSSDAARASNVRGAFVALPPDRDAGRRLGLVDDLVTSGQTVVSLAVELERRGWSVSWVLAIGVLIAPRGAQTDLDTISRRF